MFGRFEVLECITRPRTCEKWAWSMSKGGACGLKIHVHSISKNPPADTSWIRPCIWCWKNWCWSYLSGKGYQISKICHLGIQMAVQKNILTVVYTRRNIIIVTVIIYNIFYIRLEVVMRKSRMQVEKCSCGTQQNVHTFFPKKMIVYLHVCTIMTLCWNISLRGERPGPGTRNAGQCV